MSFCDLSQGLFAEYIELLVQFGYLSLFSCVYPLTAVLLLINNLTEIRSDAYKICQLFRKPFSTPVANMGVWQVSKTEKPKQATLRLKDVYDRGQLNTVSLLQIAFEVLSFVSVMSNCWLLLLSPQLQNFFQERRLSPTNALLLTVLVEVSFNTNVLSKTKYVLVCFSSLLHRLQHVLILVKLILRVLIPDEPAWIRKKREHIEFTSMQALKQQVCSQTLTFESFESFSEAKELYFCLFRSCRQNTPECISRVEVPLLAVMY